MACFYLWSIEWSRKSEIGDLDSTNTHASYLRSLILSNFLVSPNSYLSRSCICGMEVIPLTL